jgi:hypothetical protein
MGVVGGPRQYDGPAITGWLPWKCPACGVDNVGLISAGCTSCGSGSAQPRHVGQAPPLEEPVMIHKPRTVGPSADADLHLVAPMVSPDPAENAIAHTWAAAWFAHHPTATGFDGFIAGYQLAFHQSLARTMAAPPVTADVIPLNPKGKASRTIVAALQFFRDQILGQAAEEIASGEWCSAAEVDALVRSIQEREQDEEEAR